MKVACRKENDGQILLKMRFWYLNPKDGKFDDLKSFKNLNLENYLQNEVWENYFQNQRGMGEVKDDKWPLGCMPKVAMQNGSCL